VHPPAPSHLQADIEEDFDRHFGPVDVNGKGLGGGEIILYSLQAAGGVASPALGRTLERLRPDVIIAYDPHVVAVREVLTRRPSSFLLLPDMLQLCP
jgi:hypothetical protein